MRKTSLVFLACVMFSIILMPAAWSQDFQKTYALQPGSTISVASVSGDISVTGYNGAVVSVVAFREGRDREMVQIEDLSTPGSISLKAKYPAGGGSHDASVRFEIQVPQSVQYRYDKLSTASGDIKVANVAGELGLNTASGDVTVGEIEGNVQVNTASGDIKINRVHGAVHANAASGDIAVLEIAGTVSAATASGDIDVQLTRVEGSGELKFSSASGDITVKAPTLDAQVEMSTGSGTIKSDFPIDIQDTEGHGKKALGQIGSGLLKLKISTASGDVKLIHS